MFLVLRQHLAVELAAIAPTADSIYTPIVKDGCTSVPAAETFTIHAQLTKLLTEINHHRIGVHAS